MKTTALCSLLLVSATIALAQPSFSPNIQPRLEVGRVTGAIAIDGDLSDAGWRQAGQAGNFTERFPGENVAPGADTEAWIAYDDENIYVAFRCHDDPAAIRATLCQRDQFFDDDAVGIYLDTFGEAQWAYQLYVNPYGIQQDRMWTLVHGEDTGFDMVWHSAARITDDGYQVELAIPFASMRFPDADIQQWRVDLRRARPRESDFHDSWCAHDRDDQCQPCQWGYLDGLAGIRAGRGLEILPSVMSYQTSEIADDLDAGSGLDHDDVQGQASVNVKYKATSDITLEATGNPDYSQIEADADQIDVNTTIVQRFPERRPFFQEGNDLFRTYFNSFYTRMVASPEVAAKATARWTKSSLAYVFARDEDSPYIVPTRERSYTRNLGYSSVHVLRGLQSLGNNSHAGLMLTDRRYDRGGSGTIVSGDFNLRLGSSYSWIGQYVWSHTDEPDGVIINADETFDGGRHTVDLDGEAYAGSAFITELRRRADHWNFTLDYNVVGEAYRTQTGYDPWNDQRNGFIWTNYQVNFDAGAIQSIAPQFFVNGRWSMDGERKWLHVNPSLFTRLRWAQTGIQLGYQRGEEVWGGVAFDDLWNVSLNADSRPSNRLGFGFRVNVGEAPALFSLERGDQQQVSAYLDLKPWDSLVLEPTVDYIRSEAHATGDLLFEQTIARLRVGWQISRRLSLRLVTQHNASKNPPLLSAARDGDFPGYHMSFGSKWEFDPLITYRVNSFSVFYAGSTRDYRDFNAASPGASRLYRETDRQYFMKLQYLFQI